MKFFKKHRKKLIIIVIILVVIFILTKCFGGKNMVVSADKHVVEKSDINKTLDIKGLVKSKDSAEITSNFPYKVTQILVKEGDTVEKGQVLATLESKDLLNEIEVLRKQIDIDSLKIKQQIEQENLKSKSTFKGTDKTYNINEQLKIAVDTAKTAYDEAKRQEDLKSELYKNGAISLEELNQAKLATENQLKQYENAKVTLEKANYDKEIASTESSQNINIASETLKLSKMQLEQKLQNLEDLKIKSPISGVVTRVYARVGRSAKDTEQNKAMFIVEDISEKHISVPVGEYSIDQIKVGQKVEISADVLGKSKAKGEVYNISPTGEEESGGSSSRIIPVDILIKDNSDKLLSGVSATCQILLEEKKNVLNVPFSAIGYDQDGAFIYEIKEDSTIHKIHVKTGMESNLNTEIISDEVKEGMEIVKSISDTMVDGMKVMIAPSAEEMQNGDKKVKPEEKIEEKESKNNEKEGA